MGYTHYYKLNKAGQDFTEECFTDMKKVLDRYKDILKVDVFNKNCFCINGIGDNEYEDFYIEDDDDNSFTKTAHKNYDLPVCEILLLLKHYYGDNFDLSSDGLYICAEETVEDIEENWKIALKNVKEYFGYTFDLNIVKEKSDYSDMYYYYVEIKGQ